MGSGVERAMWFVGALIVGFAWGMMIEQMLQGQLFYSADRSPLYQVVLSAIFVVGFYIPTLKKGM